MLRLIGILLCLASAACGGDAPVRTSQPPRPQKIRLELPVASDVADLPRIMARDALAAKGYDVEVAAYGDNGIAIQALLSGDLDFARIPLPQIMAAIQNGAAITMITGTGDQMRILATAPEIKTCSQLHNRQVSVPNLVTIQTLVLKRYVATTCPGTDVKLVVIAGVENRLAALIGGRTSGALLEVTNLYELQTGFGSRFNVLFDSTDVVPGLNGAAVVASRAFVAEHPAIVRDYVRETILAARQLTETAAMAAAIERHLKWAPEKAAHSAQLYGRRHAFDVNGTLADEVLKSNIDFFVEAGLVRPGLTPAQVADRSQLNAVLDELGRR